MKPWQVFFIAVAVGLVIFLGIGLRLYEPSLQEQELSPAENANQPASENPDGSTGARQAFEFSPEQIAWREQALETLETLMARLQPLEEKGVQIWAPDEYKRLVESVTTGEQLYNEQRFREARDEYSYALLQVGALERKLDPTFNALLEQAVGFISAKQYDDALTALDTARLIKPQNQDVAALINTAQNGEAIDRLIVKASFALEENQPSEALPLLQEAISLDPTRADVRRLIVTAQNLARQMAFQANMQEGYTALDGRNFTDAISLFKKAIVLEPGNGEATSALVLAEKQKLADDLSQLERRASTAMADENWAQAIQHYQDALNLKSDASFANTGLARATFFNEKQSQLTDLLSKPDRLADNAVASYASSILAALDSVELPPKFAQSKAELEQALSAYSAPVQVTLVSDNRSTVTLLRRESFSPFRKKNAPTQARSVYGSGPPRWLSGQADFIYRARPRRSNFNNDRC